MRPRSSGSRYGRLKRVNETARARSEFYGLLSELLSFPTDQLVEACRGGQIRSAAESIAAVLPYCLPAELFAGLVEPEMEYLEVQSDYIRLFDLPGGGPAMPLYAGVFASSRRDSMEELLRFYRHFGLTVSGEARDLPDAIPTVLEFLHFLAFREANLSHGEDPAPVRTAEGDVLARHLLRWSAEAVRRVEGKNPPAFYRAVLRLLNEYCVRETAFLTEAA